MSQRVVITGMGALTPIGNTVEETWKSIKEGKSGIAPFTHFNPENNKVILGDIVINLDKAISQALEYGHSLDREICYLFVHGILHLLEFDHMNELDKNLMRKQEEKILSKFKIQRS